jgi:hypothetical protein
VATKRVEICQEHYYRAAKDRLAEVRQLRNGGFAESALAAYLCGLSVECALRSFVPVENDFYDRHDLIVLARFGALLVTSETASIRLNRLLNAMKQLWKNSLRFYSNDLFETYSHKRVKSLGLYIQRGARPASVVCRRLFEASENVLLECERLWQK